MAYLGERAFPIQCTAASQLERNRAVKITSGVPAYPSYGDTPIGVTKSRSDANDYETIVMPFEYLDGSFFIDCADTITAHQLIFSNTSGKALAITGTAASRSVVQPGSPSSGDIYIVPANATILATWSTATAGQVGTYTTGWAYTTPTAGDIYYVTDEGVYIVFNGSAWVTCEPIGYAGEAGVDGGTIAAYRYQSLARVGYNQLSDTIRSSYRVVVAGQTASETDADAAVIHYDQRILATDLAVASFESVTNAVYIQSAVCSAQTLTITLSGNGGASTICNFIVLRACS